MQYGELYEFDENASVIIYGAATTGKKIYQNLIKHGYQVLAFIDKRADEIDSYYDLPVLSVEQAEEIFRNNDKIISIIGIKNVFEHEKIAKQLWQSGCKRIFFRPYAVLDGNGNVEDKKLNHTYDKIIKGEFPQKGCVIEGFDEFVLIDQAIIEKDDYYVIANIPVYYVWTDNYKDQNIIWGDIPCLGLVPHIGLFNLFIGNYNKDYLEYIKFCKEAAARSGGIVISKAWEDSVYKNRLDVFNHMQYAWEHNRSFFVKNAINAVYNQKGYFNINSGKHRAVFLLVKGSSYIPLKIKKEDYYRWSDEKKAFKIYQLIHELQKDDLPVVLNSPYFYNFPCHTSDFYGKLLSMLIRTIYSKEYYEVGKFDFGYRRILLYNTPMSLYTDVFKMCGFQVDIYDSNSENIKMINAITDEKSCNFLVDGVIRGDYFLAISNDIEINAENVDIKYNVYITNDRDETGELLLSGFSGSDFYFAFLKTKY